MQAWSETVQVISNIYTRKKSPHFGIIAIQI